MPEISIIIPNYNTEKYLSRCLDSLVHQTFKDIEIIVIDDGSKDKSVEIMKEFSQKDDRVKVIEQQNAGVARARNRGLETATGKYLMFCDSDDWYEPNMCEVMHKTIEKEKVDVVCCHNAFDWEEDLASAEKEDRLVEKYYNPNWFGKYVLNEKNILATNVLLWNKIWRHDLIKKYYIRFPEVHNHEDAGFWYMYAFVAKNIFCLKNKLYHYFLRSGSLMSTQVNKKPINRMDRLTISEDILQFLLHHNLHTKNAQTMAKIFYYELKDGGLFFTEKEQRDNCHNVNQLLHDTLGIKNHFIYYDSEVLFLKDKNILKLIYEWSFYRLCLCFWSLIKTRKGRRHANRYVRRINNNTIYWKYLFKRGQND